MESLFDKDPSQGRPLSNYEKIENEIAHLKKKGVSVRHGPGGQAKKIGPWILILVVLSLVWLYIMDPFYYALNKSDAIKAYLYLHAYDGASSTNALLATHIFNEYEIAALNRRHGSFQDYFASLEAAETKTAAIVSFMNGLQNLRMNRYDQLDTLGKVRCVLFVRSGLIPPTSWSELNPPID